MDRIRVIRKSRNYYFCCCPVCGQQAPRNNTSTRTVKDVSLDGPLLQEIIHSKHYCKNCNKFFNAPMDDLVVKGCCYSRRTHRLVMVRLLEDVLGVKVVRRQMSRDFYVEISDKTIYRWANERFKGSA